MPAGLHASHFNMIFYSRQKRGRHKRHFLFSRLSLPQLAYAYIAEEPCGLNLEKFDIIRVNSC